MQAARRRISSGSLADCREVRYRGDDVAHHRTKRLVVVDDHDADIRAARHFHEICRGVLGQCADGAAVSFHPPLTRPEIRDPPNAGQPD
jgi:hypothetical protein